MLNYFYFNNLMNDLTIFCKSKDIKDLNIDNEFYKQILIYYSHYCINNNKGYIKLAKEIINKYQKFIPKSIMKHIYSFVEDECEYITNKGKRCINAFNYKNKKGDIKHCKTYCTKNELFIDQLLNLPKDLKFIFPDKNEIIGTLNNMTIIIPGNNISYIRNTVNINDILQYLNIDNVRETLKFMNENTKGSYEFLVDRLSTIIKEKQYKWYISKYDGPTIKYLEFYNDIKPIIKFLLNKYKIKSISYEVDLHVYLYLPSKYLKETFNVKVKDYNILSGEIKITIKDDLYKGYIKKML